MEPPTDKNEALPYGQSVEIAPRPTNHNKIYRPTYQTTEDVEIVRPKPKRVIKVIRKQHVVESAGPEHRDQHAVEHARPEQHVHDRAPPEQHYVHVPAAPPKHVVQQVVPPEEDIKVAALPKYDVERAAPAAEQEDLGIASRGAKLVIKSVNPELDNFPRKPACCIVSVVLLVNIIFVICLTAYNRRNVDIKLGVVDAEWDVDENNNIYKEHFKGNTHICNSYRPDEDTGFYIWPCLLPGLTCKDYSSNLCPKEKFEFWCVDEMMDQCFLYTSFASVIYVEGPSFSLAFGAAQGYLIWVQATTLAICIGIYYCCYKRAEIKEAYNEVVAHVANSLENRNHS